MNNEDDELQGIKAEDLMLGPLVTMATIPEDSHKEEPSGPDETSKFDQRYREAFTGLMFLGRLTEDFTQWGHKFELETPSQAVKLEAGLLHKPYINSISSEIAWAALSVACYLKSVDGVELPVPLGNGTGIKERFNWVVDNLRHPIITRLYEKCLLIEREIDNILEALDDVGES